MADASPQVAESPTPSQAGVDALPHYARTLLRVTVPVEVTLAEQRQPVERIMEIVPGSIIQFDKSCEELLQLSVNNHPIAEGEAVKVGDKFGLRITSIILPEERFAALRPA
jgi:flagellar motor switch protein FliN